MSIMTLLDERASQPPTFTYDPSLHDELVIVMSDASDLYVPKVPPPLAKGNAVIKVSDRKSSQKRSVVSGNPRSSGRKPTDCPLDIVPMKIGSTAGSALDGSTAGSALSSSSQEPMPLAST